MAAASSHHDPNPRLTENTCDEPEASLMPLDGYQHSDLVSLEAATESIKSLFRNLPRDVWIAKNACKKPSDSLTPDESAAIHLYTMEVKDRPLYSHLNALLRDRDRRKLKSWFSYLKLFLTALFKLPSCSAKTVWRGVKADLYLKYHRGEHYTWWAFSSCTLSLEVLSQTMYLGTTGDRTLFSIECLNGKNIKPHSYYKAEDEILLLPGFYFEVVSKVEAGNGLHIIHLREVVPPFILLEPPFDIDLSTSALVSPLALTIDSIIENVYEMNKENDGMFKLFVILPNHSVKWNVVDLFENKCDVHFVCECSINELHFNCYPPYAVPNPRVFFQIYGEYMQQFMIALAQHLFDHQIVDEYHDSRFWSVYKSDLDKITHVLDVVEHESVTLTKASNTSELKELMVPSWLGNYSLCRSITKAMCVRWVCMQHYPADQLDLIHELDDIQVVTLDINQSSLRFTAEINSAKVSRVCSVLARGLRLYRIDLSLLKSSASVLQQLTGTLCRASIIWISFDRYLSDTPSDSEKMQIEDLLKACNQITASNLRIKNASMKVNGKYSGGHAEMVGALKSNRSIRSLRYGLAMTNNDVTQMMSVLEKCQILTTLELTHHELSFESVQTIATLIQSSRTLVNLTLSWAKILDKGMRMIANAICTSPIMKRLNISGNELSDESVPFIIHLLQTCSSLSNLGVSSNKITIIGARLIFEELQVNRTLLHFDIRYNNLSIDHARKTTKYDGSIVGAGELIAMMLLKNTILCTLSISRISMSDNDLIPIGEALIKNRTLVCLRLCEWKYSSPLRKPITDVVHWNNSLIDSDLTFSASREEAIQKLSEILSKNNNLHFLNLQWCNIGDNGMSVLAQALRKNRVLTHLRLKSNTLTSEGAEALSDMLRVNTTLTCLDVGWNKISDEGIKTIASALSDNYTLTYINIIHNKITDVGAQVMAHVLKSNNTLLNLQIIDGNDLSSNLLTLLRSLRRHLNIT